MKSKLKKLQDKAEKLWKEYCFNRDGRRCAVKHHFPGIAVTHTDVFQCDHCFSRSNKHLFVSVKNGTIICSGCNAAKGFGQKSIARAVDSIVQLREGMDAWNEMLAIDQAKMANSKWNSIPYVEDTIRQLEKLLEEQRNRKP